MEKMERNTAPRWGANLSPDCLASASRNRTGGKTAFKTMILPNIAALGDAQCEQLRTFVKNGGSLIATYETSLYDEWGVRRKDFGLADLFGVMWNGSIEGPMQNSYLRLKHEAVPHHPLFKGLEDAPRIVN